MPQGGLPRCRPLGVAQMSAGQGCYCCVHDAKASADVIDVHAATDSAPSAITQRQNFTLMEFCQQEQIDMDTDLMELLEECASCISNIVKPGELLVWVSPAFVRMCGWSAEEVVGRKCNFLQGHGTTDASRAECRRLIEGREKGFVSLVNYHKSGKEFINNLYLAPLFHKGECMYFVGSQIEIGSDRFNMSERTVSDSPVREEKELSPTAKVDPSAGPTLCNQSMVEICCEGRTFLANDGPMPFDNEWAHGSITVMSSAKDSQHRVRLPERSRLAFQLQITFKKLPPDGQWCLGGEIDGAPTIGFKQQFVCNFILGALKCWDRSLTYSMGGTSSNGFIGCSLDKWFDFEKPLVAGKLYNWRTWSSFIDLEQWSVVNVPEGRNIALKPFWGERALRVVLFSPVKSSGAWTRALEIEMHWRGHRLQATS